MDTKSLFFECIKREIDISFNVSEKENISEAQLKELYQLSKIHDLTHIVAKALKKEIANKRIEKKYNEIMYLAVYRYEQKKYAIEQISILFEKAKIPYIFLKGSVLCNYYPEPWMRTSCDIDVLVHEEDLDKAIEVLVKEYGLSCGKKGSHDVSLFSEVGVHVELHFALIEVIPNVDKVLGKVWETAILKEYTEYEYNMPDEMFYFYHIAHMAKHFSHGGCGIRSFIDVWILNHNMCFDKQKRRNLLEEGGILKFAENVEKLVEVWFGDEEHHDITRSMEQYVLEGGVYGNLANKVLIQRSQCNNRFEFMLKRIFMPYNEMKLEYPILRGRPWLLLAFWIVRWIRCLKNGRVTRAVKEFEINNSVTKDNKIQIRELVKALDIEIPNV